MKQVTISSRPPLVEYSTNAEDAKAAVLEHKAIYPDHEIINIFVGDTEYELLGFCEMSGQPIFEGDKFYEDSEGVKLLHDSLDEESRKHLGITLADQLAEPGADKLTILNNAIAEYIDNQYLDARDEAIIVDDTDEDHPELGPVYHYMFRKVTAMPEVNPADTLKFNHLRTLYVSKMTDEMYVAFVNVRELTTQTQFN